MDQLTEKLLGLLRQKIALYGELAAVFEQEKGCIVSSDVAALWALSGRKQALADDLGKRRAALLEALTAAGIAHGLDAARFTVTELLAALPTDGSRALRPLAVQLLNLKDRLGALAAHNRRLIEDGFGHGGGPHRRHGQRGPCGQRLRPASARRGLHQTHSFPAPGGLRCPASQWS